MIERIGWMLQGAAVTLAILALSFCLGWMLA